MTCKLVSKQIDRKTKRYVFTLQLPDESCVKRYAEDIVKDTQLFDALDKKDLFDIAFTQGSESAHDSIEAIKAYKRLNERK